MKLGLLTFDDITEKPMLVAKPVETAIAQAGLQDIFVSEIDPALSDTAAFCDHYEVPLGISANCVVLEAHRADKLWYIACVVLATTRADINGTIRRIVNARKISFAPLDLAVSLSGMEYGGITPIGLPSSWTVLVDRLVENTDNVIIGSGIRNSKLLIPGSSLRAFPNVQCEDISKPQLSP